MNRQSNKITVIYCRIAHFHRDMEAIARNQMDLLSRYAAEHGLQNPEFFCDWGFSGTTPKRLQYQRMLREVKAGNVSDIVVMDRSRIWRDLMGGHKFFHIILPCCGVTLHSLQDNIITTPQDARAEADQYKGLLTLFQQEKQRGGRK